MNEERLQGTYSTINGTCNEIQYLRSPSWLKNFRKRRVQKTTTCTTSRRRKSLNKTLRWESREFT